MKPTHTVQQTKEHIPTAFIDKSGVKYTEYHTNRKRFFHPRRNTASPTSKKRELTVQADDTIISANTHLENL